MGERRGTKGLELWCRRMTEGYPGVEVNNMTTSWRDGLAFCAIIHHFRPDLIDFSKLNKNDIYYNNDLAFQIAERHLGIPALLEPEDMVEYPVPDRLSILTYLSQFYQTFVVAQGSPSRIVPKRPANTSDRGVVSPTSTSPTPKMPRPSGGIGRRDPCARCGMPVFIAERLNVGKQLYHRTCFRCARCNSQLTLANYYETETDQYCCETCPDEEQAKKDELDDSSLNEKMVLSRSLSDEEKSAGLQKFEDQDDYSAHFETALENPEDEGLAKTYTLSNEQSMQFMQARSRFITSQLVKSECESSGDESIPDLPKSEPPSLPKSEPPGLLKSKSPSLLKSEPPGLLKSEPPGLLKSESPGLLKSESPCLPKSEPPGLLKSEPPSLLKSELLGLLKSEPSGLLKSESPGLLKSESPCLPKSEPPGLPKSEPPGLLKTEPPSLPKTKPPDFTEVEFARDSENKDVSKDLDESISSIVSSTHCESFDSGYPSNIQSLDSVVNNSAKLSDVSDKNQPETATNQLDVNQFLTKENKFQDNKSESTSLVKSRMLLFENKQPSEENNERSFNSTERSFNTSTKSPEKFIHEVPLDEEVEQSSTGLQIEKSKVDLDSDSLSSSLVDVNNKNNESHMEVKEDSSIIVISSDSNDQSPIVISDSASEIKSEDSKFTTQTSEESSKFLTEKSEDYPEDLNPFGDDEEAEVKGKSKVESLNPFDDDDDEPEERKPSPKPAIRKKVKVRPSTVQVNNALENTVDHLDEIYTPRESYNPFDEENEEKKQPKPRAYANTMKVIPAPRISLNPFWSDGEEPDDEADNEKHRPVPLPRNSRSSIGTPEPKPRKSGLLLSNAFGGSNTSLSSAASSATTGRKKKQAPKPPSVPDQQNSAHSSVTSSPSPSVQHSPKLTPRVRKIKKAPLPPSSATSTPLMPAKKPPIPAATDISPINPKEDTEAPNTPSKLNTDEWEKEKILKDELNRNRQSQSITSPISSSDNSLNLSIPNKSTYGKWKRRKGPAPSRPIPQRRHIKPLPVGEIKRELEFIEIQQQGLEKQGVRLEQIIREKCEGPNADLDSSLAPEVEDLILQLFELVNEKNELFRKQAELMYLRRQQRLEEEYADVEYQIRCLMLQPEANKTDCDKAREEDLINRLVEVVERRNEIVECLEMDRVREAEEDDSINNQLNLYALKREEDPKPSPEEVKQKKKSKKKFKFKHTKKVDVDKDIDECESSSSSSTVKDKKKKKFNIF